jgi:hypothetical protein
LLFTTVRQTALLTHRSSTVALVAITVVDIKQADYNEPRWLLPTRKHAAKTENGQAFALPCDLSIGLTTFFQAKTVLFADHLRVPSFRKYLVRQLGRILCPPGMQPS